MDRLHSANCRFKMRVPSDPVGGGQECWAALKLNGDSRHKHRGQAPPSLSTPPSPIGIARAPSYSREGCCTERSEWARSCMSAVSELYRSAANLEERDDQQQAHSAVGTTSISILCRLQLGVLDVVVSSDSQRRNVPPRGRLHLGHLVCGRCVLRSRTGRGGIGDRSTLIMDP